MNAAELFEEVRTLLREPIENAGITAPQLYKDADLILQGRSALRHLKALGVGTDATLGDDGTLTGTLTDNVGVLVALRMAASLLRGELMQRVLNGSMGMVFRVGTELIDTKTAAIQFHDVAASYESDFRVLLTLVLSDETTVFGGPNAPGR